MIFPTSTRLHRGARPREVRARTATMAELRNDLEPTHARHWRPRCRGDCADVPRPCPYVGCKWHLYLDTTDRGHVKLNFPDLEPWELTESCALDVAEEGGVVLEAVGAAMNVTRERIRQIQFRALNKLRWNSEFRREWR